MDNSTADPILTVGGEMGALMRGIDWATTPFDTPEQWSPVLRSAVSMMLNGRFATALCWGADLRLLYNDAYRPILGHKHPESLAQPVREVFPEIWERVGPLLLTPLNGWPASFLNHMLLEIDRDGFPEETYFSASYSGIYEEGKVVGVLVICHEVTDHVQSERRLTTLRDLAAQLSNATELNGACRTALSILAANAADIPFGLLYLMEGDQTRLVASAGFDGQSNTTQPDRALQERLLGDPEQTTRSVLVKRARAAVWANAARQLARRH